MKKIKLVVLFILILTLNYSSEHLPDEYEVFGIALEGPAADRNAEISSLTWYQDYLIIMPQYPDFEDKSGIGKLFAIPKKELIAYINKEITEPIKPLEIKINISFFANTISGFEGFEAIAFFENKVFMTIESEPEAVFGYLVRGEIMPDMSEIILDTTRITTILPQENIPNASEETILVTKDRIITIYEGNGEIINPQPVAHVFDHELNPITMIPIPAIEYRITDATIIDENHEFWVINYFWPGDRESFQPGKDELSILYEKGKTHQESEIVERLVQLKYENEEILLTPEPPLQLKLIDEARNWEGLVRLENYGFIIATDKYPKTILGYIITQ
jgi:hypothetical protein